MHKRTTKRKSSGKASSGLRCHAAQVERAASMARASIRSAAEMKQQLQDTNEKFEELRFRHEDSVRRCRALEAQLHESKRLYTETNARLCTKSHELSNMSRRFKVDISLLEQEVHRRCDLSSEEILEARRLLLELQNTLSRIGFNDGNLFRKLFRCIDSVISLVHREVEVDADEVEKLDEDERLHGLEPVAPGVDHDVISLLNRPDPTKREKAKRKLKQSPMKHRPTTPKASSRTTTTPQTDVNEARPKASGTFTGEQEDRMKTASSDILAQYLVSSPADDTMNPASSSADPPEKDGGRHSESLQQLSILKEAVTGLRQVSQSSICEKLGRIQSELSEQKKSTEQLMRQNRVLVESVTESSKRNLQSSIKTLAQPFQQARMYDQPRSFPVRESSLDCCSEVDCDTAEEIPTKDDSRGTTDENVFDGNSSAFDPATKPSPFSSRFDPGVDEFERRFQALQLRLRNPPLQTC